MQNFPNSPVPLHPGFSRGGSVSVSSPYQSQASDLQISPRSSEDFAAMQQAHSNLQSQGQHLHLRSQQHLLHGPPVHAYGSRMGSGEITQGNALSASSYRKESMDYYFSVSGRERSRRGYGAGFSYTNMDGHVPNQYQHLSGSGSSSGMISPYTMDYSSNTASGVGATSSSSSSNSTSSSGGAGSFSPSQQYALTHNTPVQSGTPIQQRQHGQKYPSHQGLHHHRAYSLSGNRVPSKFGHYSSINTSSGSTVMYNSPPQRYDVSSSGNSTDAKINNSPTRTNPSASGSNSCENVGQSYSSSSHTPYSPQSQSLHKHAPHSQRTTQSTVAGYEASQKMQPGAPVHTKMIHSSIPSSPALPPPPAQDIAKSPMHSQNQQTRIHQNFSPISNPSPAPSAVQSPGCSSSSSPLMSSSEGNGAAAHVQVSSLPSNSNAQSSQSHGRLLQALPQLSPTPSSNSSISSCGSSLGAKTVGFSHSTGYPKATLGQRGSSGEAGPLYHPDKLLQDPGLNSLNALTSQVENLPNTVQHMLLTDTVLSQKKCREQGYQSVPAKQNKCAIEESSETKGDQRNRIRQSSGASNESEPSSDLLSQSHLHLECSQHGLDLQVNASIISSASKQPAASSATVFSQTKTAENLSSSPAQLSVNPSKEPRTKPSSTQFPHQKCVPEKDLGYNGMKEQKIIKHEESEVETGDPPCHRAKSENSFQNTKDVQSVSPIPNESDTDAQQCEDGSKHINISEQHNVGGVGVIVSARSEMNIESSKPTAAKSSGCSVSHYLKKHGCPEEQHDVSRLRETRNHNGDIEICKQTYTSPYDMSPKEEGGQGIASNNSHSILNKYNNSEVQYNICKSTKNKGKSGAGSEIGPDRYPSHYQLQSNYGSFARKDIGVLAGEGGRVVVSRGLDGSSQFQPSFPSLLQEVLQGHHLDRRYGLPDQISSVRNRSQDHHYQTRLPYSMIENFSSHGMAGTNVLFNQMASGKQTNFFQNQGPDKELALGRSHPAWDSQAQRPNLTHEIPLEKVKTSLTPSHVQQSTDLPTVAPQKHIILADYSLQNRKASRYGTSSSAVEQLLLQETEPLACAAGPIGQTLSSGRRSVICDVSPSRRTTPERDRATSGLSVIQQSFSSLNDQDCSKEEIKVKKEQSIEDISKIHLAGHNADEFCSTPDIKDPHKYLKVPVDAESDSERINCVKGTSEPASNRTHFSQISSNPRHQSYIQAVETFRPYGFSDTMDGPKMVSHSTSHHSFQTAASYSKTTPSPNKLQSFSQSVPPQKRPDWTSDKYRVKDTDQDVSQRQAEQKSQSLSDDLPSQLHLSQQHSYPASHFDMKMWNVYPEQDKPPAPVPREHVASPPVINTVSKQREGDKNSLKSAEEPAKSLHSLALEGGVTPAGHTSKATQGMQQGWRPTKSGASAETNPLIMRRRVRSFISPIPAKRQHHDCSVQRSASSYINNNSSEIIDTQPKIASPTTQQSTANSPLQCKTKILPPRKGRGLKLEAIVQKITPGVKKTTFNNSHIDSEYSDASLYSSDVPDPEVSMSFSSVAQGDEACLSYLDESHTLNDLMSYRVGEDAFNCDSLSLKSVAATTTSNGSLRSVPKDFDFGLGPAGSSSSLVGENDKDDFTLLGPLPPPPPLPCPVQGSPPPSSSALSDIQQFANTYQQLETRRGEQSAANLLRQKLQETGFDEYAAGDYYSHSPGNHHLSRGHHNQMASLKLANSEFKASENLVPKGYFPSGKKKGRPVGSVNKQKRAQASISNALSSIPAATLASPSTAPQCVPDPSIPGDVPETPPDQEACPLMEAPAQMQMLKLGEDNEERLPEVDVKPHKPKQKKGKEGNEGVDSGGGQRRRRRGMSSKEEQDTQACSRGNMSLCGIVSDIRYNVFSPYIHVEKKIAEIGAVCTVVNGEEEKSKSGSKVSHLGVDASLSTSLSFQAVRREKENERCKESRVSEQVESDLQPRKTLPSSGFVLPGPVTAETAHTGRLLCCLCQKWANNKHLGDLYGPFYPAEYAAKLPKNQPQIRQSLSYHGTAATGLNTSVSKDSTSQDTRLQDPQNVKFLTNSDCTGSHASNPISPATTFGSTAPGVAEEITFQNTKTSSFNSRVATHTDDRQADHPTSGLGSLKVQEPESLVALKQLPLEDTQQWPQHRKLTSHPRFKRRHKSSEDLPGRIPINNKASLPFQPPPPSLDSMGPMAQLAQLPLVPLDPQELWVHEGCIIWTSGIYLVNGRLYGLQEALDGARDASCSHCDMLGSTLGCYSKGCTHRYHYLCALEADCSLDEDNFSLRCPKHKSNRISKPGAAYLEQSERG